MMTTDALSGDLWNYKVSTNTVTSVRNIPMSRRWLLHASSDLAEKKR